MIPFYRNFAASGKAGGNWSTRRGYFCKRLRCLVLDRHPKSELHVKRIMIDQKKNKTPEYYLQGRAVCLECGRVLAEAYLSQGNRK